MTLQIRLQCLSAEDISFVFLVILEDANQWLEYKTSLTHTMCLNMEELHTFLDICELHARLARLLSMDCYSTNEEIRKIPKNMR